MQTSFRKIKHVAWAAACVVLIALPRASMTQEGGAEEDILLVSDAVTLDPEADLFTATGDVEVYFDGNTLTAPKVVYNLKDELVTIEGPFVLTQAEGNAVVYGDFAELSTDMADGVIKAVRYVVDENLKVTASEVMRSEGRYSDFKRVRASTCKICSESQIPLWEVQAKAAVHDNEKKHVTYRNAKLLIRSIPVAYVPWVRMPDPSIKRADGFLFPKLRFNSALGNQLILPYFKTLGDSADVTLSPNIALTSGRKDEPKSNTLEARYRQRFNNGYLELNGAFSSDTILPDKTRSYLFSNGEFQFANDINVKFQTQAASDKKYLGTYNFFYNDRETFMGRPIKFDVDRLTDKIEITRYTGKNSVLLSYVAFKPLLEPEHEYKTANAKLNFHWLNQTNVDGLPGNFKISTAYQIYENDFGSTNVRKVDLARSSINLFWNDTVSLGGSLSLRNDFGVLMDSYRIKDDDTYQTDQSGVSYFAASNLSWPLTVLSGTNYNTTFSPSLEFVTADLAKFDIPTNDDTNIGLLDPYDIADIARFSRLKRDQNFNHQLSYVKLDTPVRHTIFKDYYLGVGMTKDVILHADDAYPLENGLTYRTEIGKSGPGVNFSVNNIYNESGKRISEHIKFMVPVRKVKLEGQYLKRDEDQVFYTSDQVEKWSFGLSADMFNRVKLRANTSFDMVNDGKSISAASFEYNDGKMWRASFDATYNRDYEQLENRNISLGRKFGWGGELFYTKEERIETSDRSTFGLSFDNECMKFQADYSRYQDLTADAENVDEFTIMIRLGNFGASNARRCG